MKEPYFKQYSLVLIKDDDIIFSSDKHGLRPLIECVIKYKSKIEDCILYDKVIGLASAKIIVYSNIVSKVIAKIMSKPAEQLLKETNIHIRRDILVEKILTKDKNNICPMEKKALSIKDNEEFFKDIVSIFYNK